MSFAEIRAFLESGAAWDGRPPDRVVETHTSLVLLTRDRAWKLKKPVELGHIDLRSLSARAHFCREELRLNRELAGAVYRGITPLVRLSDGTLALDGKGAVVDWLIEMERLPETAMLSKRLAIGPAPDLCDIEAVCSTLIGFYRGHGVVDGGTGYFERLVREAEKNALRLHAMRRRLGRRFRPRLVDDALSSLAACRSEIVARGTGSGGVLVEGHGDLRAEHVCLVRPPVIFDRLEFDRAYRVTDPWDEFNALGLECELAGAAWIRAVALVRLGEAVPRPSAGLLRVYGVNWCLTRARLAIDHLLDAEVRTPGKWAPMARRYIAAASRLADAPEPSREHGATGVLPPLSGGLR